MIFVAMSNPQGNEPLWPQPSRSAGHVLWSLINEAMGWSREVYLAKCERIHFREEQTALSEAEAHKRYMYLRAEIGARRAICVGKVAAVLMQAPDAPFVWKEGLAYIPHTAGLNRFYNDADNRARAVAFLKEALS